MNVCIHSTVNNLLVHTLRSRRRHETVWTRFNPMIVGSTVGTTRPSNRLQRRSHRRHGLRLLALNKVWRWNAGIEQKSRIGSTSRKHHLVGHQWRLPELLLETGRETVGNIYNEVRNCKRSEVRNEPAPEPGADDGCMAKFCGEDTKPFAFIIGNPYGRL